jgi:hypothetical protein
MVFSTATITIGALLVIVVVWSATTISIASCIIITSTTIARL